MELLMRGIPRGHGVAIAALGLTIGWSSLAAQTRAPQPTDHAVKAAFLLTFPKFIEWPIAGEGPLALCVVAPDSVAATIDTAAAGRRIGNRAVEVTRPADPDSWRRCDVLFLDDDAPQWAGRLGVVKTQPVLTVSDHHNFSRAGGMIELYLDEGRVRFHINASAAERAGLKISSHLLKLAADTK
jgi:hypothetical protein